MIKENLTKIDGLIEEELKEYDNLSELYDEKKQVLIKSKTDTLINIDNKIKEKVLTIKNIEEKRKHIDEQLGLSNACMSDYIKIAHINSLALEEKLSAKKARLFQMSQKIAEKEHINSELIKQGMKIVNKLIRIFDNGAGLTGQYDNNGKNIQNSCVEISSIVQEV